MMSLKFINKYQANWFTNVQEEIFSIKYMRRYSYAKFGTFFAPPSIYNVTH